MPKVIIVGKPRGTPKPQEQSPARSYREGFLTRVVRIVLSDIKALLFRHRLVVEDEPDGWEDYRRFCEMARGKK